MNNKPDIIYVDDEKHFLTSFKFLFRKEFNLHLFQSANEAIKTISDNPDKYNGIIADYNMAEKSGAQLLEEVSDINPDIPRILLSGFIDEKEASDIIANGIAHYFISKPFSPDEIRKALNV